MCYQLETVLTFANFIHITNWPHAKRLKIIKLRLTKFFLSSANFMTHIKIGDANKSVVRIQSKSIFFVWEVINPKNDMIVLVWQLQANKHIHTLQLSHINTFTCRTMTKFQNSTILRYQLTLIIVGGKSSLQKDTTIKSRLKWVSVTMINESMTEYFILFFFSIFFNC